jgi:hypothetical protein
MGVFIYEVTSPRQRAFMVAYTCCVVEYQAVCKCMCVCDLVSAHICKWKLMFACILHICVRVGVLTLYSHTYVTCFRGHMTSVAASVHRMSVLCVLSGCTLADLCV